MITVTEAIDFIKQHIAALATEQVLVSKAFYRVVATDINSKINLPAFKQSGMDGYAFRYADHITGQSLKIVATIPAGSDETTDLLPAQAVRIFTGAPVPHNADTVVMQEKVAVANDDLIINDDTIKQGTNVRPVGSDIANGKTVLQASSLLTPAAIGMLAGIGETAVEVYKQPVVSIIVTGNELQQPGNPLLPGQVYESNSTMLAAALQQLHLTKISILYAADNIDELQSVLNTALSQSDMVLLTGGVSVGDFDFVAAAAENCGVKKVFHKIKQRPGKPLFFGLKDEKVVFGLPGNPSSVLTCFYEYVTIAIQQLQGTTTSFVKKTMLPLATNFTKPAGLTHFLKAKSNGRQVTLLGGQESYKLSSFAGADCLAVIPEDKTEVSAGEVIEVHFL